MRVRALKQRTPISPLWVCYLVDEINLRHCDIFEEVIRGARPNFSRNLFVVVVFWCVCKRILRCQQRERASFLKINIRVKKLEQYKWEDRLRVWSRGPCHTQSQTIWLHKKISHIYKWEEISRLSSLRNENAIKCVWTRQNVWMKSLATLTRIDDRVSHE